MTLTKTWRALRPYLTITFIVFIVLYFLWAALQGDNGFFRMIQVRALIEEAEGDLEVLIAERERLENLTRRMSSDYLDLDLLDEQARKRLGLTRPDEIILQTE